MYSRDVPNFSVQVQAIPFTKIEACQLREKFSINSQLDSQTLGLEKRIESTLRRNLQLKFDNSLCIFMSPNFKPGNPHNFKAESVVNLEVLPFRRIVTWLVHVSLQRNWTVLYAGAPVMLTTGLICCSLRVLILAFNVDGFRFICIRYLVFCLPIKELQFYNLLPLLLEIVCRLLFCVVELILVEEVIDFSFHTYLHR